MAVLLFITRIFWPSRSAGVFTWFSGECKRLSLFNWLPAPKIRNNIIENTNATAIYCNEGGDAFWTVHRGPARRLGCEWADALGPRLTPGGRSLYVGAGVAELPAMLHETLDLGRTVVAANLRGEEIEILKAGMRSVGIDAPGLEWVASDVRERAQPGAPQSRRA